MDGDILRLLEKDPSNLVDYFFKEFNVNISMSTVFALKQRFLGESWLNKSIKKIDASTLENIYAKNGYFFNQEEKDLIKQILDNADEINKLYQARISQVCEKRINQLREDIGLSIQPLDIMSDAFFWRKIDSLSFPLYGLSNGMQLLKQTDSKAIRLAIIFLMADPYFHRSGYIITDILYYLKKVTFNEMQLKSLNAILVYIVQSGYRREFRKFCKFAKKINSKELQDSINLLSLSQDSHIVRRAEWMKIALD